MILEELKKYLNDLLHCGKSVTKSAWLFDGDKKVYVETKSYIGQLSGEKTFNIIYYYKDVEYGKYDFDVDIYDGDIKEYEYNLNDIAATLDLTTKDILSSLHSRYNYLDEQINELKKSQNTILYNINKINSESNNNSSSVYKNLTEVLDV